MMMLEFLARICSVAGFIHLVLAVYYAFQGDPPTASLLAIVGVGCFMAVGFVYDYMETKR